MYHVHNLNPESVAKIWIFTDNITSEAVFWKGHSPSRLLNDLARTLGIPNSIAEACRIIAEGNLKYIDLGWVNNKYFFNVASLGLSVKITQKLSKGLKRRLGILAYAWTALQVLSKTRPFTAINQHFMFIHGMTP